MGQPLKIGVVGLGGISQAYLRTLQRLLEVEVTALADLDRARAESALASAPGARVLSVPDLVASGDVDLVLNLTVPAAHSEVALAAVTAGKHVYGEKPFAATVEQARAVLDAAGQQRVGCAPDTVLGTGVQTARKAVEDGLIGWPIAANAAFSCPGHERWHANPEFYYRDGGGPLLDMGPYYLTALVHILGPVKRVVGVSSRSRDTRVIGSGRRTGTVFEVEVATHVAGILVHETDAVTTLAMSFDIVDSAQPKIEVHGDRGSLTVPDPNEFSGDVTLRQSGDGTWRPLPPSAGFRDGSRGVGVADLAASLLEGRPHRASADVALHVLDVMVTILAAAEQQTSLEVRSRCARPALVPLS
jgi:predicted dehydrogenase